MTAMKEEADHALPDGFIKAKVLEALTALVNRAEQQVAETLFPDSATRILMDITTFKIPEAKNRFFNIVLPYKPHPDDLDILLVIPDMKNTSEPVEPEVLVAQVKDRLQRTLSIKIREVMTLKQLKDEFSTYEGKRQLTKSVDLILADMRVFKSLAPILGREFYRKKKYPIAMTLDKNLQDFKNEDFHYALRKTVLNISTVGTTSTIVVGQTNLSAEALAENVSKIAHWLNRSFPGKWKNIAKMSIYTAGVPPLIIYLSKGTRNDIEGKVIGKGRKLPAPEEDELSTMPGKRVRVHLDGRIRVLKDEDLDASDEELIEQLGVDEELSAKRIRNDIDLTGGAEGKKKGKKGKSNIEENYVDATIKRQDFEDEEEAAAEAEAEAEEAQKASKAKSSKKKKSRKIKKVKA